MIDWSRISREDHDIVVAIAPAAEALLREAGARRVTRMSVIMDLTAAHLACPLQLAEMRRASAEGAEFHSDFCHDIGGIYRHLNRETGELEDCFVPRFAYPAGAILAECAA